MKSDDLVDVYQAVPELVMQLARLKLIWEQLGVGGMLISTTTPVFQPQKRVEWLWALSERTAKALPRED